MSSAPTDSAAAGRAAGGQGEAKRGKVVVAWSAHGSVGRSSIVAALAVEIAKRNHSVLIIDADTYAPSQVQLFGFDQNFSGISAAVRANVQGRLDVESFERLLLEFELQKVSLRLLAGLTMVDRWPEIGFEKMRSLIEFAKARFDFVFVDIAASIEPNLVDTKMQSERNSAAIGALASADHILAICQADVVGINRFVWATHALRELRLEANIHVLVNKLNQSALGRRAAGEVASTLKTLAEVEVATFIDDDAALFAKALAEGLPVTLVGRNSSAKQALTSFALANLLEVRAKGSVAKLG